MNTRTKAQNSDAPLLALRNASFAYSKASILNDISCSFQAGEFVGVIGPNGAGKTTLLRLLSGILQPTAGEALIDGYSLLSLSRREIAREIALVPQDITIPFAFNVKEIVAMGRTPYLGRFESPGKHDLAAIEKGLKQADVAQFCDRYVDQLSGGERQRVLIARALTQETAILLLDEPTANLDISHQLEILTLVKSLTQEGVLAIAAIHDLNLASRYCDRLLIIGEAGLQSDGPPVEIMTQENLSRYFGIHAVVEKSQYFEGLQVVPLSAK